MSHLGAGARCGSPNQQLLQLASCSGGVWLSAPKAPTFFMTKLNLFQHFYARVSTELAGLLLNMCQTVGCLSASSEKISQHLFKDGNKQSSQPTLLLTELSFVMSLLTFQGSGHSRAANFVSTA